MIKDLTSLEDRLASWALACVRTKSQSPPGRRKMPKRVTQEVLEELAGAIKLTPMTSEHKEPQVQGHQKWRLMKILSTQEGLLPQRLISPALLLVDILSID